MTGGDLFLARARVGSPAQECGTPWERWWARGVIAGDDAGDRRLHVSAQRAAPTSRYM
jgi:hypothetical protein